MTPEFEAWFSNTNRELATARRGGKVKVTTPSIEAGLVDFKELTAQTRAKMHASDNKGQQLGSSRGKSAVKPVSKRPGRPKKR